MQWPFAQKNLSDKKEPFITREKNKLKEFGKWNLIKRAENFRRKKCEKILLRKIALNIELLRF